METWDDVVAALPVEVQAAMSEDDLKDLVRAIARDPHSAADVGAAWKASNATIEPGLLEKAWDVLQTAASIASVVTSIGGAAAMVGSL